MANLHGKGSMTQQKLIATWKDSQATIKNGYVTGAYLDVQLDQSDLTSEDIKAGKGQTNPHLNSQRNEYTDANGEKKQAVNHGTWYSLGQIEFMTGDAVHSTKDGLNVASFTADIISRRYTDKEGKSCTRLLVACPKDLGKVSPEDRPKAEAFNNKHKITPNLEFDADALLERQDAVTVAAKEQRKFQYEASHDLEVDKGLEAPADDGFEEILPDGYDPFG